MSSQSSDLNAETSQTAVPHAGGETSGFVGRFGLNPWLFAAQVVNILIVLLVLRKFVFRPLLTTLRKRADMIERGMKEAETARQLRVTAESEKQKLVREAQTQSAHIVHRAEEDANALRESILRRADEEAASMHDRAEQEARTTKEEALRAVSAEAGNLVVDALEQVLASTLTPRERERVLSEALRALRKPAS